MTGMGTARGLGRNWYRFAWKTVVSDRIEFGKGFGGKFGKNRMEMGMGKYTDLVLNIVSTRYSIDSL